ncbi:hypothetical protein CGZ98_14205 [Enemella evansiae]|uniref:FtsX-like permease family protein n=1 Tax=Enemella evansiae TaxID=2016499 RepID=UPI000B966931|nr:FtsX-like permease family protein [Enemella evansiae]OYO08937.1 hypothetical protein CGZ98_14205 [Enemella evansiae]
MITWVISSLRGRVPAAVGMLLAVLIGTVISTATTQILLATRPQVPERLSRVPVVIAGEQATDVLGRKSDRRAYGPEALAALVAELRRQPGVTEVIADRSFLAQVVLPAGTFPLQDYALAGHGWASMRLGGYRLIAGAPPAGESQVALAQEYGARVGETVRLRTAQGERAVTVSGLVSGPGIYVADSTAGRLAPAPSVLGVEVAGSPGAVASSLTPIAAAHRAEVVQDRRVFEDRSVGHQRYLSNQFLLILALASLVITVFVVAVISKFAVDSRTGEFGLLRAIGVLPAMVGRTVLLEAAVLGLLGSGAGVAIGLLSVPVLADLLRGWGILPIGLTVPVQVTGALAVGLAGLLSTVLSAGAAAVAASRVGPLAAMRAEGARIRGWNRTRLALGALAALMVVAELVLGRVYPNLDSVLMAIVMALTTAIAAVCLTPMLLPRLSAALSWPVRRLNASGPLMVGFAEIRANPGRAASLAAPVIMAITLSSLTSGFIPTMRVAYPAEGAAQLRARSVLVPDGAFLTAEQVASVRQQFEVERVALTTRAQVRPGGRSYVVPVTSLPSSAASDEFTVPRYLAEEYRWRVGSPVTLGMSDGRNLTLAVTAVIDEPRAEHPGIELSEAVIAAYDPVAVAEEVFLRDEKPGRGVVVTGGTVQSAAEWATARYDKDLTLLNRYLIAFVALAVGYAVLAAVITIAMTMRYRKQQNLTLFRVGALDTQIRRAVVTEAVTAGVCGVLLGAISAMLPLHEMAAGLSETAGQPVGVHLGWGQALGVPLATVLLLGLAAAVAVRPRRNASRGRSE